MWDRGVFSKHWFLFLWGCKRLSLPPLLMYLPVISCPTCAHPKCSCTNCLHVLGGGEPLMKTWICTWWLEDYLPMTLTNTGVQSLFWYHLRVSPVHIVVITEQRFLTDIKLDLYHLVLLGVIKVLHIIIGWTFKIWRHIDSFKNLYF